MPPSAGPWACLVSCERGRRSGGSATHSTDRSAPSKGRPGLKPPRFGRWVIAISWRGTVTLRVRCFPLTRGLDRQGRHPSSRPNTARSTRPTCGGNISRAHQSSAEKQRGFILILVRKAAFSVPAGARWTGASKRRCQTAGHHNKLAVAQW